MPFQASVWNAGIAALRYVLPVPAAGTRASRHFMTLSCFNLKRKVFFQPKNYKVFTKKLPENENNY